MLFPIFDDSPPTLHEACGAGDPRLVKQLLERGANPASFDVNGLSPLHYACSLRTNVFFYLFFL